MAKHAWIGIALAVWLIGAAFLGLSVSALPNHVVGGGVFGPGGDMSPGASNPANAATMVFYSTNQPTYPLLTGADSYTAATGTEPAIFAKDVGATWTWLPGDELVSVIETIRGVNGWSNTNYTSSIDAFLLTGASVQDIGNSTLEAFPTLSVSAISDNVTITWPRIPDASGNVLSYGLYRTPGPGGPIATVPQAPLPSYTDSSLAAGTYCYTLQVNYRRDLSGGTYGTTGRSERRCASVAGPIPVIQQTDPANGATAVHPDRPIVVDFSEPMSRPSLTSSISPNIALVPVWSNGDATVTLTHASPFTGGTLYTVTIGARDLDGNNIVSGPVPNPWSFTTNSLPSAQLTAPALGVCATGGSTLTIRWTMSDPETLDTNLRVWLNYSDGVTTFPIAGMQDQSGMSSPGVYNWPTPTIDATITILLTVMDEAGQTTVDSRTPITIDSTRPTVAMTQPSPSATSVATDTQVILTFSEAMDRTSVQDAISFTPTVAGLSFNWAPGDRVVTVGHAVFTVNTSYTLRVAVGARDACSPGLALLAEYTATFTTGAGARVPKPPTNLRVTSASASGIALAWDAPTQYTDNTLLTAIAGYDIYRATSATGSPTMIGTVNATTYTDTTVQAGTVYFYWVKVRDVAGRESAFSAPVSDRAGAPPSPGIDPLLIIILIIIVALVIAGVLLLRRRKPAPAPMPAEETTYAPEQTVEETDESGGPPQG